MLEDVLELTLTDPREALMIGDTTYDMQMARDAGVDRVAVSYGAHEARRLLEFSPLEVIDSLAALENWLSGEAMAK
jgi:phosphoglycolate phosphatase